MTRRRARTDGLSHHVATRLMRDEIDALITQITSTPEHRDTLLEVLETAQTHELVDHAQFLVRHTLTDLRQAELRTLLADVHDEPAIPHRSCRICGRGLDQQPHRGRGRPREYCSSACRQTAYRRRKGQRPRELTMTALVASALRGVAAQLPSPRTDGQTEKTRELPAPEVLAAVATVKTGYRSPWRNTLGSSGPDRT